jgi:adenine-specific DNA-methyltransferase
MNAQGYRPNQMYAIVAPGGAVHRPPPGRCWSMIESEYKKLLAAGRIYFGKDNNSQPNVIRYLTEVEGMVPWT